MLILGLIWTEEEEDGRCLKLCAAVFMSLINLMTHAPSLHVLTFPSYTCFMWILLFAFCGGLFQVITKYGPGTGP